MQEQPRWQPGIRISFPTLMGNVHADVAIIGGGLTGVTCALMLTSLGKRVILLERDTLGCGATTACTGKVTAHQPQVYDTIVRSAGRPAAAVYARLMQECVQDVVALCERLQARCSFASASIACYAAAKRDLRSLRRLAVLQDRLGLPITAAPNTLPRTETQDAVALPGQALLPPLPYLEAMARSAAMQGCAIYEHTPVTDYSEHRVLTAHGTVRAAWVIVATGYPLSLRHMGPMALMQQHMLETRQLQASQPFTAAWIDSADPGVNLRPVTGGVLLSCDLGPTGHAYAHTLQRLEARRTALLPAGKELQRIHRPDVWSLDGLPLIGAIRPQQPHLLMASGYNGWGLTGSMLAARVLGGIIIGVPLTETALFAPKRVYRGHTMQQLRGMVISGSSWLASALHLRAPICPHMGCRLHFDAHTGLWSCPCHGSCFDQDAQPVRAPAAAPAPIKRRQ